MSRRAKLDTSDVQDATVRAALDRYLAEYGSDGYDRETFIDYVVVQVLGRRKHWWAKDMRAFYEKRAVRYAL